MGACEPASVEAAAAADRVVLVVDDEVLLRMAACAHLRDAGFVVVEAVNAAEAVALLAVRNSIGLVFTDINMPGAMDGVALAALIAERYPAVRILLTSGVARDTAMPFLAKPYSFAELRQRIEELLPEG